MSTSYTHSGTQGNVLFYILIAVALLAALSYAVTQSNRGSIRGITTEQDKLIAAELIEYGNIMSNAVSQLRLRGVDDTDLCFDDPAWGVNDYDHAGCTDDYNKIFHTSSGGLTWSKLPDDATDINVSPDFLWHIYGDNEIDNIGTTCGSATCSDLILVADELRESVCIKINDLLGITNPAGAPPTDSALATTRYIGSFDHNEVIGDEAGGVNLSGQSAGCFRKTSAPVKYTFYTVLIAR